MSIMNLQDWATRMDLARERGTETEMFLYAFRRAVLRSEAQRFRDDHKGCGNEEPFAAWLEIRADEAMQPGKS